MSIYQNIVKANFRTSIPTLLNAGEVFVNNVEAHLPDLAAQNSRYTQPFVDSLRSTLADLRVLPSNSQRVAVPKALRTQLTTLADNAVTHYLSLVTYVNGAFPDTQSAKRNEAGYADYLLFRDHNWEHLADALPRGKNFVSTYNAELTADGGMPAAFPAAYGAAMLAFLSKYHEYETSRQTTEETNNTTMALNDFYKTLIGIAEEARVYFAKDAGKRKQFVWTEIVHLIEPHGAASLTLEIDEAGLFTPVDGAHITIQKADTAPMSANSDPNGHAHIGHTEPGRYRILITHGDFETFTAEKIINDGAEARLNVLMTRKP
jgi:hypothetical protein